MGTTHRLLGKRRPDEMSVYSRLRQYQKMEKMNSALEITEVNTIGSGD